MAESESTAISLATQSVDIPAATLPERLVLGTYANQISQISSDVETIIDFSVASPLNYSLDETNVLSVQIHHEVVSRMIIPKPIFVEFVRTYILRNPDALGLTLTKMDDNDVEFQTGKEVS